jgi:hypothetical protein
MYNVIVHYYDPALFKRCYAWFYNIQARNLSDAEDVAMELFDLSYKASNIQAIGEQIRAS